LEILSDGGSFEFVRIFHVEAFRGGMNRLLLRSWATDVQPTRLEVLFMNAKFICMPMALEGLVIQDATAELGGTDPFARLATGLKVFVVVSGDYIGRVVAGSVGYVEDTGAPGDPSSFFKM
jgi:hypothetical protein